MLRGTFATMAVTDLLEWIERRRISGRLVIDGDGLSRTFTIDTGAVVWVSSTEPTEQLGRILRGAGTIDDVALAASMADGAATPLGARLVEHGAVAPEALRAALMTKIREAMCDVVVWRDGMFDLDPGPVTVPPGVRAVIAISDALATAARRASRWPAIRDAIPDDDTGFRRVLTADPELIGPPAAAVDDGRLLAAVDAGMGVRAIVAALGGERFAVLDRLAELVEAGVLELAPESETPPTPAELVAEAERHAAAGAWDQALHAAAQAYAAAPDHAIIAAVYRRVERAQVAALARAFLVRADGRAVIPVVRRGPAELDGVGLTDLERRLLHAVDGRWDLLTLVHNAPVRAAEALVVLARLADRGIVALDDVGDRPSG